MPTSQIRSVSYGEAENRQVRPAQVGEAGADNRCVSLVIDIAGVASMTPNTDAPDDAAYAGPGSSA